MAPNSWRGTALVGDLGACPGTSYTQRQKETYRFFRATLVTVQSIQINHNWAQISYSTLYQAHLKEQTFA